MVKIFSLSKSESSIRTTGKKSRKNASDCGINCGKRGVKKLRLLVRVTGVFENKTEIEKYVIVSTLFALRKCR